MNAFLAVQLTRLPINNILEVLHENFGMIMWQDGIMETYFRGFDPETHEYGRTDVNAKQKGKLGYIGSTGKARGLTFDQKSVNLFPP